MQFNRRLRLAGAPIAAAVAACLSSPTAVAGTVPLGGGAGIIEAGTYCTLSTIGHDRNGDLVGFTVSKCGGPGTPVVAEGAPGSGPVGTVAVTDDALGYAVIKLDSAKINPLAAFNGFPIVGIGPDPGFQQPVCIQGGATGQGCGSATVPGVKPSTFTAILPLGHFQVGGDEGAPVTAGGQLVGMVRGGRTSIDAVVPGADMRITLVLFSAILNDVNAKGGLGVDFTPIAG
jgi:hypothetical protein